MAADPLGLEIGEDGAAAAAPSALGTQLRQSPEPRVLDQEQIYCRRLGHYLQFYYCRRAETGDPCPRAAECWYDRPAVLRALDELMGPIAAAASARQPTQGKLESILAIVARVRAREDCGPSSG